MAKENYLFQLPIPLDIIQQWEPLDARCVNPANCGATSLALSGAVPREIAQQEGYNTETTGVVAARLTEYLRIYLDRYKIEEMQGEYLVQNLISGLQEVLLPNNITIIFFHRPGGEIGHFTLILKTIDHQLILLDGQTALHYTGEDAIIEYIRGNNFNTFSHWEMNNEKKRQMIDDIHRENEVIVDEADDIVMGDAEALADENKFKRRKRGGKKRKTNKRRKTNKKRKTNKRRKTNKKY